MVGYLQNLMRTNSTLAFPLTSTLPPPQTHDDDTNIYTPNSLERLSDGYVNTESPLSLLELRRERKREGLSLPKQHHLPMD